MPEATARRLVRRWLPAHRPAWEAVPPAERAWAFARLWSSMEAVAKTAGVPLLPGIACVELHDDTGGLRGDPASGCRLYGTALPAGHLTVARQMSRGSGR
ncbi:MAG: 4'-phosphopantetheinyl transferase superfamily protein [Pseudonocardia sp.]|nr:4'-phosphopantetheinyl transferase superfamily protein [Pseudonocardia sp.]